MYIKNMREEVYLEKFNILNENELQNIHGSIGVGALIAVCVTSCSAGVYNELKK